MLWYLSLIALASSLAWPMVLSIQGVLKPSRWLILGGGFFLISIIAFVFTFMTAAILTEARGSEFGDRMSNYGQFFALAWCYTGLSAIGCVFAAALHRDRKVKVRKHSFLTDDRNW